MVQGQTSSARRLVFSPEEQFIHDELVKVLPTPPDPGLDKQELLDKMGWEGQSIAKREEEWHKIYGVILKSRRMTEQRQDAPLLEQEFTVEGGDFIHAGEVSS